MQIRDGMRRSRIQGLRSDGSNETAATVTKEKSLAGRHSGLFV